MGQKGRGGGYKMVIYIPDYACRCLQNNNLHRQYNK